MRQALLLFVLFVWATPSCYAQLTVVSTSPAEGAVSVPVTTTIGITFSQPVDTTFRDSRGRQVGLMFLSNGFDFQSFHFSPDLRTYLIDVVLQPDRDYALVIAQARSTTGQTLQNFVPLNFSTSSSRGNRTVSGHLTFLPGNQSNTVVGLSTVYPLFQQEGFDGVLGCIYDSVQSLYHVSDARSSVAYWPFAYRGDSTSGFTAGVYDPNSDGYADSIVIGESDLTNINISMRALAVPEHDHLTIPSLLRLTSVYPNPFNPSTSLSFDLAKPMLVTLRVYNTLGQLVATLLHDNVNAGTHTILFDGRDLPSGIFIARLETNGNSSDRKMLLLK